MDGALQLATAGLGVNIAGASATSYSVLPGIAFIPIEDIEDCAIWLLARADDTSPGVAALEQIAAERGRALQARRT